MGFRVVRSVDGIEHSPSSGPGGPGSFAALLRRLRRESGFTQESLALMAGVSVRAVRDLELGSVSRPRPSTLLRLAGALGLSPINTRDFVTVASGEAASALGPSRLGHGLIVPAQLPRLVSDLVGREQDLRSVEKATASHEAAPVVVCGDAGIGKSALVLAWAHGNTDRYPDGQLYIDLRSSGPDGSPMTSDQALGQFVRALSGPGVSVPDGVEERLGLYRSLAAGRRLLVVLDDAATSRQVTDLLPPSPQSMAVVTSRRRLDGLVAEHGASIVELQPLAMPACVELLARHTGPDFLRTHPETIIELVVACRRLPGLLTVAGAQLAASPPRTTESIAALLDRPRPWRLDNEDSPPSSLHIASK